MTMNVDGIYNSLDETPGKFRGGAFEPVDGIGTRYVASGKIRVYIGHHMPHGRRWIYEDDAQHLGIALPPNPNAKSAAAGREIKSLEVSGRVVLEPTEGDEQVAFFRARPSGECPCGRMREGCPWHG